MHVCAVCPVLVHDYVQVPLMAALPTAQAAMDAHRGVAAVAEQGLGFLKNLAFSVANRVRWACGRLRAAPWFTSLRTYMHACSSRCL